MFELYDKVRIKSSGKLGFVVAIDDDGGTKPPIYFVEISQEEELDDDEDFLVWLEEKDITLVER